MSGGRSDPLLHLFRLAAGAQPAPGHPHPLDDEELLTLWSAGQLPPAEHATLIEHLSRCASCRRRLAELLRAGILSLPEPSGSAPEEEAPAGPVVLPLRARRLRRRLAWGLGAAAAVLLVSLAWLSLPRRHPVDPIQAELARAEQELEAGDNAAALARLEQLDQDQVEPAIRERARPLLEQAAYRLARRELEGSHFARVREIAQQAGEHGIRSARLVNLKLQAERGIPAETALAGAWSLLTYGYELDGSSFNKGLPEVDEHNKQLNEQMTRAVEEHPQDAALRVNHGQFLLSLGNLDAARKRFEEARERNDRLEAAHLGLGLVAFQEDRYAEALRHFRAALDVNPDSIPGHLDAAICLQQMKHPVEARQHRQRVLELTRDARLRRQIEGFEGK